MKLLKQMSHTLPFSEKQINKNKDIVKYALCFRKFHFSEIFIDARVCALYYKCLFGISGVIYRILGIFSFHISQEKISFQLLKI